MSSVLLHESSDEMLEYHTFVYAGFALILLERVARFFDVMGMSNEPHQYAGCGSSLRCLPQNPPGVP